jgi:hypothetical protein
MLKRLCAVMTLIALVGVAGLGHAQTVEYQVELVVPEVLSLGAWLLEIDSVGTSDPSDDIFLTTTPASINFGTLEEDADGWKIYRPAGGHYYMVNLIASTSSRPYTIQHTMSSTGNTDVDSAVTVTPIFSDALAMIIEYPNGTTETKTNADLGYPALPTGAVLDGKRLAVGTWNTFTSSPAGETLILGEVWGMYDGDVANQTLDNNAAPLVVGVAQPGTVSGTVTYTLTLN